MIARLRTYNALRATVGPCDAHRMAWMAEQAELQVLQRAIARATRPQAEPVPITIDGPHPSRSTLKLQAWLRFARWAAIAVAATWCLFAAAGVVYALAFY